MTNVTFYTEELTEQCKENFKTFTKRWFSNTGRAIVDTKMLNLVTLIGFTPNDIERIIKFTKGNKLNWVITMRGDYMCIKMWKN